MCDGRVFVEAARLHGYGPEAAEAALAVVEARLAERGAAPRRLFCFRTAGEPPGGGESGGAPPARPRVLLLFTDADGALGFAQSRGLGRAPRLSALSLAQALATLVQRPTIGALLIAGGEGAGADGLPPGLRVERADLLALLAGEAR